MSSLGSALGGGGGRGRFYTQVVWFSMPHLSHGPASGFCPKLHSAPQMGHGAPWRCGSS